MLTLERSQNLSQYSSASACPHEVENADQTSGVVHHEHDEPEVANVPPPAVAALRSAR
jgi:hypothetical protein